MKKLVLLCFMLGCCLFIKAQTDSTGATRNNRLIRLDGPSNSSITKPPLWIINDKQVLDQMVMKLMNPNDIEDLSVLKGSDASTYGDSAKNGVIKITLKPNVKLINLQELFKRFNVKKTNRQLNVYINSEKLMYPNDFYVGSKWVKKIKVITAPTAGITEQNYIILTK